MFQPSALHTDFARRVHEDRRAGLRIVPRHARAEGSSRLAALIRHLRHTVPQPAPEYDGAVTAH